MKCRIFVCVCLFAPCTAFAQQTRFLPLDELFRLGEDNSLRVNASHIQENIAREQTGDARTGHLPEVLVGIKTGYMGQSVIFRQGLTQPVRPGNPDWQHNYNISIAQPVYQGGRIRYSIEKAALQEQIAALTIAEDQADVKMILLRQYLDLFSLYKQQEVFARNIDEAEHRLTDIQRMKREGLVTRNDEIRSELELTNYRLALRETGDNIVIVSRQLDILLGLDESLLLDPDSLVLGETRTLRTCAEYVEDAYDNYPELNIARKGTALARNDIRITRSAYLPSLAVQGSNTLARPLTSPAEDMFSNNWNVVLSLSFNLSSLYRNRHKMEAVRRSVSLGENREQQIMQNVRIQVQSAYIHYQEALDRVQSLRLAVAQAEENYRIVNNRYLNQLSILTDLLDADNIRLQAELQLTAARAQTVYNYYELLHASGKL